MLDTPHPEPGAPLSPETREIPLDAIREVDSARDPNLRRVADVLRAGASARKTILIEDEDNIREAVRHGVVLKGLFVTGRGLPSTPRPAEGSAESAATAEPGTAATDPPPAPLALPVEIAEAVTRSQLTVYRVTPAAAKEIFGSAKRARLFALASPPRAAILSDLPENGDIIVLDGVTIVGNIGAITRTARALGAAGVVAVGSGLESAFDRRLVRASRGTVFALPLVLADAEEVAAYVREKEIPLVVLSRDADHQVTALAEEPGRVALLAGSERRGPSAALAGITDRAVSIPIDPEVDSLNVSVATGIALFAHRPEARGG